MEKVMHVEFKCSSNAKTPWINTAIFMVDGEEVVIDRDTTEWVYDAKSKVVSMNWSDVYIWDGEDENYDIPVAFMEKAVFKEFDIEDDAPENYEIKFRGTWLTTGRNRGSDRQGLLQAG